MSINTSYYLIAKSDILAREQSYILAVRIVMGVFNGALMLFAVLGYGNMVLAGLLERRGEFAIMRSIGMTGKQLREMLLWEGIFYSCCVAGLVLSLGNVILRVTGISIGIPLAGQVAGHYSSHSIDNRV